LFTVQRQNTHISYMDAVCTKTFFAIFIYAGSMRTLLWYFVPAFPMDVTA